MKAINRICILLLLFCVCFTGFTQNNYKNFKVSVYTRAYEVQKMADAHWLDSTWQVISSQLKVNKIYLETHRDLLIVDQETLKKARKYFTDKGIEVAGGITYTIDESNQFETFCYTNPEHRAKAQEIIEFSAKNFDEVILDDFFFTSCKCTLCVKAKGDQHWSDYRLKLMTDAAENIIMKPAKKVNPNVKVIIKYPNWYDHFHELGFNLETQPAIFDGLYTGTETRDAVFSNQHLQPYLGYLIFRYFEHLKPGKNGGGWVDTGGMKHYDRYAEQLWLTLFAKAPEMTLFDYRQLLYPLRENWEPAWKTQTVSFNYAGFLPVKQGETVAKAAGHALDQVDEVLGELGTPVGIKSYKPFHASGEDFLQNYFGMIGIPMELVSSFPTNDPMIILTEQAAKDPEIVQKIEQRLINGKDVIITSGLLNALQNRGIRKLVKLEYTSRKSVVSDYLLGRGLIKGNTSIVIPQIQYATNDSWEIISGMDSGLGWPLLHQAKYANATLYLLTIPENFADLYNLPLEVLNQIRTIAGKNNEMVLEGPAQVSLFTYDNGTFIVESFLDESVEVKVVLNQKPESVQNLIDQKDVNIETREAIRFWGRTYSPEKYVMSINLPPHSFGAYKINH